ncbi:Calcium-dependent protein kinase 5 [Hondaea fermentalgiana]|uniref:Calcium-dependent protein kinase 5 n=1 Tax=Hondaea fermentalgiana TaxID=2315210 RepID=A0A2R5GAC9_9STRA|nr:Calcium-dependent protein kinase 5 [Hondaea fermentalgiana]|eukprot:GBG27977.1 Calcium-dependent protein kinase 5 [Hondaea fermentalgiana]
MVDGSARHSHAADAVTATAAATVINFDGMEQPVVPVHCRRMAQGLRDVRAMTDRFGAPLIDPDEKHSTFRRMASLGKSLGAVKVDTKVTGATSQAVELLGITKKDLAKLRIRFDAADIDGSGDITRDEFFKMLDEHPTVFTNAVFSLIDVDNSNTISYNEMVHVLTTFCIFNQNDILFYIFQQFDKDGSGSLDEHEFIEMIADLNAPAMFPGNLQRAFENFDTNADGLIDFDEFKELNNRFPMLLFPIFRLQDKMQRRTLGARRWTQILKKKAEREKIEAYKLAHDGDLPPKKRKSRFEAARPPRPPPCLAPDRVRRLRATSPASEDGQEDTVDDADGGGVCLAAERATEADMKAGDRAAGAAEKASLDRPDARRSGDDEIDPGEKQKSPRQSPRRRGPPPNLAVLGEAAPPPADEGETTSQAEGDTNDGAGPSANGGLEDQDADMPDAPDADPAQQPSNAASDDVSTPAKVGSSGAQDDKTDARDGSLGEPKDDADKMQDDHEVDDDNDDDDDDEDDDDDDDDNEADDDDDDASSGKGGIDVKNQTKKEEKEQNNHAEENGTAKMLAPDTADEEKANGQANKTDKDKEATLTVETDPPRPQLGANSKNGTPVITAASPGSSTRKRRRNSVDSANVAKRATLRPRLGGSQVKASPMLGVGGHASLAEGDEDEMEVDRPGESYPIRHPRYEMDAYQAPLPELRDRKELLSPAEGTFVTLDELPMRHMQLQIDENVVWRGRKNPAISSRAIDEYLFFCRQLTREKPVTGSHFWTRPKTKRLKKVPTAASLESSASAGGPNSAGNGANGADLVAEEPDDVEDTDKASDQGLTGAVAEPPLPNDLELRPAESDEQALEFLHRCEYDIKRAKFMLLAAHGAGTDSASIERKARLGLPGPGTVRTPRQGKSTPTFAWDAASSGADDGAGTASPAETSGTTRVRRAASAASTASANSNGANSGAKGLKNWVTSARSALAGRQPGTPTRRKLLQLLQEYAFVRADSNDAKAVASASEVAAQVEKKLKEVDDWIANAHDAVSLTKPDGHWTLQELQEFVSSVPSGVRLAELDCLKSVYASCVSLQEDFTRVMKTDVTPPPSLNELRLVLRRAQELPLDLPGIEDAQKRVTHIERLAEEILDIIPANRYWRKQLVMPSKSKRVATKRWESQPLATLRAKLQEAEACRVSFPTQRLLKYYVDEADAWLKRCEDASNGENVDVKLLLKLVKQAEVLPVDLTAERERLDAQLRRAQECIAKVRNAVPRAGKTTRGAQDMDKMELETLRALKNEAISIGIKQDDVDDMQRIVDEADAWKARARAALEDVDAVDAETLNSLIAESDQVPVIMPETDFLLAQVESKQVCEQIRAAIDSQTVSLRNLTKLVNKLSKLRKTLQVGGQPKSLDAGKCENLARNIVNNAVDWVQRAHFLCRVVREEDFGGEEKVKPKKRKRNYKKFGNQKTKLQGPFAAYERVTFSMFANFYKDGAEMPVDLSLPLQDLITLRGDLEVTKASLRAFISSCGVKDNLKVLCSEGDAENVVPLPASNVAEAKDKDATPTKSLSTAEPMDVSNESAATETQTDTLASSAQDNTTLDAAKAVASDAAVAPAAAALENGTDAAPDTSKTEVAKSKKPSLSDIKLTLDKCLMVSVATVEEVLLRQAFEGGIAWIAKALALTPHRTEWEGVAALPKSEAEELSLESIKQLLEEAPSLYVDVSELTSDLEGTLDKINEWKQSASNLMSAYEAKLAEASVSWTAAHADSNGDDETMEDAESAQDDTLGRSEMAAVKMALGMDSLLGRTKRETVKKRASSAGSAKPGSAAAVAAARAQEQLERDAELGLVPRQEEAVNWANFEAGLDAMVASKFPELGSMDPMTSQDAMQLFAVPTPEEGKTTNENTDGSSDGSDTSFKMLPDDFATMAADARKLCDGLENEPVAQVAEREPAVQKARWLAEAGDFLEKAGKALRGTTEADMDTVRALVADGVRLKEVRIDAEAHHLKPYSFSGCIARGTKRLQRVGRNICAWNQVTQKRLGQAKSAAGFLALRVLVAEKLERSLFPTSPVEAEVRSELGKLVLWAKTTHERLSPERTGLGKADEIERLAAEGAKLKVNFAEVKELRSALRRATAWLKSLKRSGIESGTASVDHLVELLDQSEAIPVDLSEHTRVLKEATRQYCLCRRGYTNEMLACSYCDEWFHIGCVNISPTHAKRCARFCCPLCSVNRTSLAQLGLARAAIARVRVSWNARMARMADDGGSGAKDTGPATEALRALALWMEQAAPLVDHVVSAGEGPYDASMKTALAGLEDGPAGAKRCADVAHVKMALQFRLWSGDSVRRLRGRRAELEDYDKIRSAAASAVDAGQHEFFKFVSGVHRRAQLWSSRANAALHTPVGRMSQEDLLKELENIASAAQHIPVDLPEELAVSSAVMDEANRYCFCQGLNLGTLMVFCDSCQKWLHAKCCEVDVSTPEEACRSHTEHGWRKHVRTK